MNPILKDFRQDVDYFGGLPLALIAWKGDSGADEWDTTLPSANETEEDSEFARTVLSRLYNALPEVSGV